MDTGLVALVLAAALLLSLRRLFKDVITKTSNKIQDDLRQKDEEDEQKKKEEEEKSAEEERNKKEEEPSIGGGHVSNCMSLMKPRQR